METSQSIQNRSSCREFSSKEVPSQYIKEILEAARHAPSPKNRQPWRFVVLRGEEKTEFLELISVPQNANMYFSLESKQLNEQDSYNNSYHIIQEADTVVLVFNYYFSNFALNESNTLFDITNIQAIGASIQNMLLKATDLGIGSLWMCDVFSHYNIICDRYYPTGQFIASIAFGYPRKKTYRSKRKPLSELIIRREI